MTDDELKELVASLAVGNEKLRKAQEKTDEQIKLNTEQMKLNAEQFKHTDEQFKLTTEQFKLTTEQFKHTDEQFKRTDEQFKRTDEQFKRTDEQFKRTDEQLKRTDEQLKRIGIHLGGISQNQGDVAEEFFFNSLVGDTHLGPIHFEDITMNMQKHRGQLQEQYDLVLTNGDAVGIIEVKYKAHENDLDKLERKMKNFKQLFPWFKDYKLYGAIASFHINDDSKRAALERGFFVLQRSGKVVHTDCAENLKVL